MKKRELKTKQLFKSLLGYFGFAAIILVFLSCGGEPLYYDIKLSGVVKSKETQKPIMGIKIMVSGGENNDTDNFGFTDKKGKFEFYASVPNYSWHEYDYNTEEQIWYPPDSVRVRFFDVDGSENGTFELKTIFIDPGHKDEVKLNIELEPKN